MFLSEKHTRQKYSESKTDQVKEEYNNSVLFQVKKK